MCSFFFVGVIKGKENVLIGKNTHVSKFTPGLGYQVCIKSHVQEQIFYSFIQIWSNDRKVNICIHKHVASSLCVEKLCYLSFELNVRCTCISLINQCIGRESFKFLNMCLILLIFCR